MASTFVGVLPFAMNVLALLLFVHQTTGSYAAAGMAASGYSIGKAAGIPVQGYLVDRHGAREIVVRFSILYMVGAASLIILGVAQGPLVLLVSTAGLLGFSLPQLLTILAAQWPTILVRTPELQPTGYASGSALLELSYIGGPLLVGGLAAAGHPGGAIALSAFLAVVGAVGFTSSSYIRSHRGSTEKPAWRLEAVDSSGLRTLMALTAAFGFSAGSLEVVMATFATTHGAPGFSGILLAAWAIGGFTAGIAFGAFAPSARLRDTYLGLAAVLPFALAVPLVAGSLGAMAIVAVMVGLGLGAILPATLSLVREIASGSQLTQTYAWQYTSLIVGVSIGIAVAGVIVENAGWRSGVLAATAAGIFMALLAIFRRSSLVPPPTRFGSSEPVEAIRP